MTDRNGTAHDVGLCKR